MKPTFQYNFVGLPEPYGFTWHDLAIDYRQLGYSQGYSPYHGAIDEQFAVARVAAWFVRFYLRFASHIQCATAYELPIDGYGSIYQVTVIISGTRYELAEIEKAMFESGDHS